MMMRNPLDRTTTLRIAIVCTVLGVLLLWPVFAHCAERTPIKWLTAMAAAQGADLATTCTALHSGRFREANGVLPGSCGGIATVKALSTVGSGALVVALSKSRPRLAKFVAVAWVASGAVPAAINLRRMH